MDKKTIFKVIKCSNWKESVIRAPAAGKVAFLNNIKLYVTVVTFSAKEIKYQNSLAMELTDQFIRMNIKQKLTTKI